MTHTANAGAHTGDYDELLAGVLAADEEGINIEEYLAAINAGITHDELMIMTMWSQCPLERYIKARTLGQPHKRLLADQKRYEDALALMQAAQEAFGKARSVLGQALAMEAQACARRRQGQAGPARLLFDQAFQAFGQAGLHDGEARVCVRLGDLDAEEAKPLGGEGWYQRALKLSRQNKPGDYTLGALTGLAGILHKQGRKLEALRLALLCERILHSNLMPASEAEFHAELGREVEEVLARIGTKLMRSVIEEARAKMAQEDARVILKESMERYWS